MQSSCDDSELIIGSQKIIEAPTRLHYNARAFREIALLIKRSAGSIANFAKFEDLFEAIFARFQMPCCLNCNSKVFDLSSDSAVQGFFKDQEIVENCKLLVCENVDLKQVAELGGGYSELLSLRGAAALLQGDRLFRKKSLPTKLNLKLPHKLVLRVFAASEFLGFRDYLREDVLGGNFSLYLWDAETNFAKKLADGLGVNYCQCCKGFVAVKNQIRLSEYKFIESYQDFKNMKFQELESSLDILTSIIGDSSGLEDRLFEEFSEVVKCCCRYDLQEICPSFAVAELSDFQIVQLWFAILDLQKLAPTKVCFQDFNLLFPEDEYLKFLSYARKLQASGIEILSENSQEQAQFLNNCSAVTLNALCSDIFQAAEQAKFEIFQVSNALMLTNDFVIKFAAMLESKFKRRLSLVTLQAISIARPASLLVSLGLGGEFFKHLGTSLERSNPLLNLHFLKELKSYNLNNQWAGELAQIDWYGLSFEELLQTSFLDLLNRGALFSSPQLEKAFAGLSKLGLGDCRIFESIQELDNKHFFSFALAQALISVRFFASKEQQRVLVFDAISMHCEGQELTSLKDLLGLLSDNVVVSIFVDNADLKLDGSTDNFKLLKYER